MRVVGETLAEQEEMGLVESLYHLAATGHCPPTIKEWLVEQLTERGHKRWDHAVTLGYSKMVEITHENLLPALDRCAILLSSLRGLASYHEDTGVFDVAPSRFTMALDVVHNLRLLSHNLLFIVSQERKLFSSFSKWLRHEIDTQGADSAPAGEENGTQDAGLDFEQVLSYIRGPLLASQARPFVGFSDADSSALEEVIEPLEISKQMDLLRLGKPTDARTLSLKAHFLFLIHTCKGLFESIVEWQLAGSAFDVALLFEEIAGESHDMRMVFEDVR